MTKPFTEREIAITMTGEQWSHIARATVGRRDVPGTDEARRKFLEVLRQEAAKA